MAPRVQFALHYGPSFVACPDDGAEVRRRDDCVNYESPNAMGQDGCLDRWAKLHGDEENGQCPERCKFYVPIPNASHTRLVMAMSSGGYDAREQMLDNGFSGEDESDATASLEW